MTFHSDLLRVDCFVGREIIQRPTGPPRPCGQYAPVIQFSRLSFVDQSDDPAREPRAIIFLDAVRTDDCITPAARKNLLMPVRLAKGTGGKQISSAKSIRRSSKSASQSIRSKTVRATKAPEKTELHHHRDRPGGVRWSNEIQRDVDLDGRVGGVIDLADQLFRDDRYVAI